MTTSLDTEFYRRFAARVRTTVATTPEGSPTMNDTTTVETTEAAPAVPATFLAEPDGPCQAHTWCIELGDHDDHHSKAVAFDADPTLGALSAYLYSDYDAVPDLVWSPGYAEGVSYTSGDELREQVAKVRAHLARLDAFADEYDAIREAGGEQPEGPISNPLSPLSTGSVPRAFDDAAKVTAPGARGALMAAYLFTPVAEFDDPEPSTYLTVYSEPSDDDDMNVEQAREFRTRVAGFLPKLDAMIAAMPGAVAEPLPVGGTWTITTKRGVDITGYLPSWAEGDPSETELPAADLGFHLSDLTHDRWFDGQPIGKGGGEDQGDMLNVLVRCTPYNTNHELRLPVANVNIADDAAAVENLDPDGVADLAAKLRAQADRLDNEVRPLLIAARADWARNGGTR